MRINFVPTLGGNTFYLGNADDEDSTLIKLEFINEFSTLPKELKKKISNKILSIAISDIIEAIKEKHNFAKEGF